MKRRTKKQKDILTAHAALQPEFKNFDGPVVCYFDGCCEPVNPYGNMGIGACVRSNGNELFAFSHFIPANRKNSNNVAEYLAFEAVLDFLKDNGFREMRIQICGDSKLVINQMLTVWKMNGGLYIPFAERCLEKLKQLRLNNKLSFALTWIPREQNGYADKLSKAELISRGVEFKLQPLEA